MELGDPQNTPPALVKLNVGGRLFETTVSTLTSAGPNSLLSSLASSGASAHPSPVFVDRDPDLFSPLLSLLRTGRLPSSALLLPRGLLSHEAHHYGLPHLLRKALRPPLLLGYSASISSRILPPSDPLPSTLHPLEDDGNLSLLLAHKGQISTFDYTLSHSSTLRTHLDHIHLLRLVTPDLAAVGSHSTPGLHLYHLPSSRHAASLNWSDPSDPRVRKARVAAITSSPSTLFASFECPHRENAILSFDKETLTVSSVLGRQSGSAAKTAVPEKLVELSEGTLLFAMAVSSGAFGYSGYMRLWDTRTGGVAWETSEPGGAGGRSERFGDTFADADVDVEDGKIYKVCSRSGDVGMADLRMLGDGDPWEYLEERSVRVRDVRGGEGSLVRCYKGQVFLAREGALEVWARAPALAEEATRWSWNYVDSKENAKRGDITIMEAGGERLFVCREGMEGVEVWESSDYSRPISLSDYSHGL